MEFLKRVASILLRISISIILLIFLFRQVDSRTLLGLIKNANKPFLILAFVVFFFSYVLCLYRWEMLLKAAQIHLPLKRVIISFSAGIFFSLFLPSTIGGDFMRSLDLATHTKRPREVVATVLLDRLSGYVGLVILALLAVIFGWKFLQASAVLLPLAIIAGILIVILLVLFNQTVYSKVNKLLHSPTGGKIREAIKNLHQELYYFRRHKLVIVNSLILSLFVQISTSLTFYFIAIALGLKIKVIYFFIFLPIIGAITLLPISIGGLGLRDATTVFFFAKAGASKDLSFAMSLLSFIFILIYGAIGGLIYVFTVRHRRIQHHQPPAVHHT